MSEPIINVMEGNDGPFVQAGYEGKLYHFRRESSGKVRCYWWSEGRFNINTVRRLNPLATEALREYEHPSKPVLVISVVERPRYGDTDLLDPDTRILGSITRIDPPKPADEGKKTPSKQLPLFTDD